MINKLHNASFIMLEALIVLVYFYPVAELFPSYVQIGVFFFWVLFSINNKKLWQEVIPLSILNGMIFVLTFFRCIIADQLNLGFFSTLHVVIARYQLLICPILFVYVRHLSLYEKRRIFTLAFMCIIGTIILSLYYVVFVEPLAIRYAGVIQLFGAGDFMLMYAIAIAMGPLLLLILERLKHNIKSRMLIIAFILMLICLIVCKLVTSVIVAAISIFVMLIVKHKKKILMMSSLCFLAWFSKTFIAKILYYIAEKKIFFWSTNDKIVAIANLLSGDTANINTLSDRYMIARWSLLSFMKNPLFGINWKDHVYGKIGCHMQWADDLGRYGLLGNVLLIVNYVYLVRYTVRNIGDIYTKKALIAAWITFFILGFLNPCITITNLMMIFIVIPSFEALFPNKNVSR